MDIDKEAVPKPIIVTWNKKEFEVVITEYVDNKTTCIVLLNPKTKTIEAKATANLSRLPDHLVYIKDYSENRGIADVLRSARLISRTGETIRNGSEEFEQHEILPKLGSRYNIILPEAPTPPALDPELGQAIKLDPEADAATSHAQMESQQEFARVQKLREVAADEARELKAAGGEAAVAEEDNYPDPV